MRWLIVIVLLGWLLPAWGQSFHLREHRPDRGLGKLGIDAVFESAQGILYFSSDRGLLRYSGEEFVMIALPDTVGSGHVTACAQAPDGTIWLGLHNGAILHLNTRSQSIQPWYIEEGWPATAITGFAFDAAGRPWIGTYGEGIYCLRGRHLYNFDQEDGLPAVDVYDMVALPDGTIAVGTDGGLSLCSWVEDRKRVVNYGLEDGLPDMIVKSLAVDATGNLWLGTYDGGPAYFERAHQRMRQPAAEWPGGAIHRIVADKSGNWWFATENQGLYCLTKDEQRYRNGPTLGRIYDLWVDAENIAWVIDNESGIQSFSLSFAYLYPGVQNIQTLAVDAQQRIWLGTRDGLYYQPTPEHDSTFLRWPGVTDNIISLCIDPSGLIWLGTFGEGLLVLDPVRQVVQRISARQGLTNGNILSLVCDRNQLHVGTLGGLFVIDYRYREGKKLQIEHIVSSATVSGSTAAYLYFVYVGTDGKVWLATDGEGLSYWQDNRVHQYPLPAPWDEATIYSIAQSRDNTLWLATAESGILRVQGDSVSRLVLPQPITPEQISTISVSAYDELVISYAAGISLYHIDRDIFAHYGTSVGLEQFQPPLNARHSSGEETLLATNDYLVSYRHPFTERRLHSEPILIAAAADLERLDLGQAESLPHYQNDLSFNYFGLWYTDPSSLRYRYRLAGHDRDWIYTIDRTAVYSQLAPGTYTFEVSSSVDDSFAQAAVARYTFTINSPLWQRAWFIVLALAIMTTFIYWLVRQRIRRLHRTAELRREMVANQYETLKSQINPHFLFNSFNTLVTLIEEEPGQAVTYVEKLADFYRSILQYRERDVISLSEEIKILQDYGYLLKERYGENIQLEFPSDFPDVFVPPLSLQILLENAIKHNVITRKMPLRVRVFLESDQYVCVTNNVQPKLRTEKSTGFGLQNLYKRYELLSDLPLVIEQSDEVFVVKLPLIKKI